MKNHVVYVQTRLEIEAKDKDYLEEILDEMDYNFSYKREGNEHIKDMEIQEFTDREGELVCNSSEYN